MGDKDLQWARTFKKMQKWEKGFTITLFPARAKYFASIVAEGRGKQECTVTIETSPTPSESVTHTPNPWFKKIKLLSMHLFPNNTVTDSLYADTYGFTSELY